MHEMHAPTSGREGTPAHTPTEET